MGREGAGGKGGEGEEMERGDKERGRARARTKDIACQNRTYRVQGWELETRARDWTYAAISGTCDDRALVSEHEGSDRLGSCLCVCEEE